MISYHIEIHRKFVECPPGIDFLAGFSFLAARLLEHRLSLHANLPIGNFGAIREGKWQDDQTPTIGQ